jgi:hypothetical protein
MEFYMDRNITVFNAYVYDAMNRYRQLNTNTEVSFKPAKPFLTALKAQFTDDDIQKITFYDGAVKVFVNFLGGKYIIDYDYEKANSVFVYTMGGDLLLIKDGNINEMLSIVKSFY